MVHFNAEFAMLLAWTAVHLGGPPGDPSPKPPAANSHASPAILEQNSGFTPPPALVLGKKTPAEFGEFKVARFPATVPSNTTSGTQPTAETARATLTPTATQQQALPPPILRDPPTKEEYETEISDPPPPLPVGPVLPVSIEFPVSIPMPATRATQSAPTFTPTGVLMLDTMFLQQNSASQRALGVLQDGTEIRRARLGGFGEIAPNLGYRLELEHSRSDLTDFADAWFEARKIPGIGSIRIGRWKQPFSIETATSIRHVTFLERGVPFAFNPFRRTGIGFYNASQSFRTTWAASLYRSNTDRLGNDFSNEGGWTGSARLTSLLMDKDDGQQLVHLGASVLYSNPSQKQLEFGLPSDLVAERRGEQFQTSLATTGPIAAHSVSQVQQEIALVHHSFSAQGELVQSWVTQIDQPDVHFWGLYGQVSFFLTGEHRVYDKVLAGFTRIEPYTVFNPAENGVLLGGAWEVAARYGFLDIEDDNIKGGRVHEITVGLNWHLNSFTKIEWNWVRTLIDDGRNTTKTVDFFGVRGQFEF